MFAHARKEEALVSSIYCRGREPLVVVLYANCVNSMVDVLMLDMQQVGAKVVGAGMKRPQELFFEPSRHYKRVFA